MLFRERGGQRLEPRRFRADRLCFALQATGRGWHLRMSPVAELSLELALELAAHLQDPIAVALDDARHERRLVRATVPLADVRDELARLRAPLARLGGVGVTMASGREVLRLTELLEIEIEAPTDRWRYLLAAQGAVEVARVESRVWHPPARPWRPHADVRDAVDAAASRLGLQLAAAVADPVFGATPDAP
ncbi:MAG: hypothetical protein SFW08_10425 [Gemmatimonadaceae bacterium]|nr:hypothetical protein [Gemmatimonadaceae bacterium]